MDIHQHTFVNNTGERYAHNQIKDSPDVAIDGTLQDKEVLQWNDTNKVFNNVAPSAVAAEIDIGDLKDVTVAGPAAGHVLAHDGVDFDNYHVKDVMTTYVNIDDLKDVTITTPSLSETLTYDGTFWKNVGQSTEAYIWSGTVASTAAPEYYLANRGATDHTTAPVAATGITTRWLARGPGENVSLIYDTTSGDATTKIDLYLNNVNTAQFSMTAASGIATAVATVAPGDKIDLVWDSSAGMGTDPGASIYGLAIYTV